MSRTTKTVIGKKAREYILEGVNAIYEPVRRTLGPNPRKILAYRTLNRGSRILDDGYAAAEIQEPKNPFVRQAAQAFKEACKRTNEKVGDGTATTATIGGKLYNDVHNLLTDGASEYTAKKSGKVNVNDLRRKLLKSSEFVKEEILKRAIKTTEVSDLEKIATISVNDPVVGKVVAKMAHEVGVDGFIDVVEGYKGEIETEINKGGRWPMKIAAKAFMNNPNRFEMVAVDCPILITNHALDNNEIGSVLQQLNATTSKIVIVASSFSENVLVNMVNAVKQGYFIYPVHAPSLRTEQFEDLSTYCGAKFIDKAKGMKLRNIVQTDLGFIEKLVVKGTEVREDAVVTGGRGTLDEKFSVMEDEDVEEKSGKKTKRKVMKEKISTQVAERINVLKGQLENTQQETFKKLLERRIASMASAVGVIRVGDSTQASALDLKMKIEDAVYACKSALRGGYVKGGGLCLKEIADLLESDDILKPALKAPYEEIQSQVEGGLEISDDIIDPAEAEFYAVEHAVGVVANLATVETITIEDEETSPGDGYMAMARMLGELSITLKRHHGQLRENEEEMERDRLHGLTIDEKISLDQG